MGSPVQITSPKNPIVGRFAAAARGETPGLLVADGVKIVEEALDAGLEPVELATSPRLVASERGRALRRRLLSAGVACIDCSDAVLERLSSLTTHQGVAAILRRPAQALEGLLRGDALVVVAAGVKDPGNLGALVRTAEAAGASGLIAVAGGADPFRDKAVRGSAGSVLRLPVLAAVPPERLCQGLRDARVQVVVADAGGERDYADVDWRLPTALVLGGEGPGVPGWLETLPATRARIPMRSPVESLNVAVAAGVLLFAARRQRG